ncbi:hypothetical protein FO440_06245 [Mucilaginibacter corticis]|uniref:Uncharacterized protein n=1 Tax=Mucilaginibacter corticis TaxID=2597670 RepID=A0A556MV98_9SPHI|nr:hypothetical protein [Mucilaginibacter corticis]TSJ43785.1 hypothetical protein FO440_06245 [Mucilaginibacter corticis]
MPVPAHKPIIVLPSLIRSFFADISFLTTIFYLNKIQKKETQMPVRARGRESGLWSGSDRPDLIFGLLLYQDKSNSHPAAIEPGQAMRGNGLIQRKLFSGQAYRRTLLML